MPLATSNKEWSLIDFSNGVIKFANYSSEEVSSWQFLFIRWPTFSFPLIFVSIFLFRCIFQVITVSPVIFFNKSCFVQFDDWKIRLKVICQALIGGAMLFCLFEAIDRLPIGDFSAISFSSPVFTMILSTFILRERLGKYEWQCICLKICNLNCKDLC